jgi:hypothetical protein
MNTKTDKNLNTKTDKISWTHDSTETPSNLTHHQSEDKVGRTLTS